MWDVWLLRLAFVVAVWLLLRPDKAAAPDGSTPIPFASGAVPLLGHALAYKRDAPGFLAARCAEHGPIFRVNLAGKRMVVIGPCRAALRQVIRLKLGKLLPSFGPLPSSPKDCLPVQSFMNHT